MPASSKLLREVDSLTQTVCMTSCGRSGHARLSLQMASSTFDLFCAQEETRMVSVVLRKGSSLVGFSHVLYRSFLIIIFCKSKTECMHVHCSDVVM